jgi:transcriptional regulator with XRE-family HTH domain
MANEEMARAFGEFIRAQRRLANLSQRQLGRMSGLSDSYLSQVERGMFNPSATTIKALARAFGIPTAVLYAQFGLLDEDEPDSTANECTVEIAIQRDPRLAGAHKQALRLMYRSFIGEPEDWAPPIDPRRG